ncbi:MAG: hypothetical protein EOL87_01420 [Spartobacteria bacterium]|nr:hypothetical protein [Spartobacteria bacterium]
MRAINKLLAGVLFFVAMSNVTFAGDYGIMPLTTNTLLQWQEEREETPDYTLPPGYVGGPREVNLLTNMTYDAKIRDQGHTGSCWMWGCQAVLTLEYARQYPEQALLMTNGFSVEFISSYVWTIDLGLNSGGTPVNFKQFFDGFGYAVPWGNTNAAWTDGQGYVATLPSSIYTTPNMPIDSIELQDVNTFTASVSEAVTLLKSVLDSGHAMTFCLSLANETEWDKFMNFWGKNTNDNESTIFTNFVSGEVFSSATGGAHMMACVGYNDTDDDISKHYWTILNSWSTGDSAEDDRRPHGTWRLPMYMNYGSYLDNGMGGKAAMFEWSVIDTCFTNAIHKNISISNACLNASDPSETVLSFTAPITVSGVISSLYSVVVYVNNHYFTCSPSHGTWSPYHEMQDEGKSPMGDKWRYQSNSGESPAIELLVDTKLKTWNGTMTGFSADDCRYIDLHDGLSIYAQFMETDTSTMGDFCSHRSMAYDELNGFVQQTGPFSSSRKPVSFTFTAPADNTQIQQGGTCVIEWEQQGLDNMLLSFAMTGFGLDGQRTTTIVDQIPVENGRFEWQVPPNIRCVTNQTLRAVIDYDNMLKWDGPELTIVPSTNPVLYVRSPVSDEQWVTGTVRSVSWDGLNLDGDITIELISAGQVVSNAALTVDADLLRADYTLPSSLATGEYALQFTASGITVTSGVFAVTSTSRTEKAWTILVYFDADNDLENDQIADFLEIARVGSDSNVNVLVQMDRIPDVYVGYDNWYTAKRYYMTNGITPTIANAQVDLGEITTAHPGTYTDFINWGAQNYPAEKYMLIMCDHGSGWPGALYDMTPNADFNVPQPMTTFEQGISNAVVDLDIIGYDTCLMAAIESAYQLRHSGAEVYIGSQYMETMGWAYAEFLRELQVNNGQMTARALATRICDLSAAMYASSDPVALSAVSFDELEPLAAALSNAVSAMIEEPENRAAVREQVSRVASNYYQAVIHCADNQATEHINTGLNIYFPTNFPSGEMNSSYANATLDFITDTGWLQFLQNYTNTLADTWIGEVRDISASDNTSTDIDFMRFFNNLNPPDDTVWVSVSAMGEGSIEGASVGQTVAYSKGDRIQLIGRGQEEKTSPVPVSATHFVRWSASDGAAFSNELTEATNTVTVTANTSIIGHFFYDQSSYEVTVASVGSGTVNGMDEDLELTIDSGSDTAPLYAVPADGFRFAGWGGDMAETANPLIVSNVISDLHVLALFWDETQYWSNNTDITWWQAGTTNFTLSTPQQLAGLAQLVNDGTDSFSNKTVHLGCHIDLSDKEWTPIGSAYHAFAGSMNGQGFTIDGLTVNRSEEDDYLGLIGVMGSSESLTLENIHLTNTLITGGSFIGGIAGQVESLSGSVTLRNCSAHGHIYGEGSIVGGLVGEFDTRENTGGSALVSNCVNRTCLQGESDLAGIAGRMMVNGEIFIGCCTNEGSLMANDGLEIGGIAGMVVSITDAVNVQRCKNDGTLNGDSEYLGGIVGRMSGGDCVMNGCENHGNITVFGKDNAYCGGLVGHLGGMLPELSNGLNTGDIFGNLHVGGIAGQMAISIKNCSNEGRVEGDDLVGGVAGSVEGQTAGIENCHNAGYVISTGRVGGVIGRIGTEYGGEASSAYFRQTETINATLDYVGEMVPETNYTQCATYTGMDGVLSTNGFDDKTYLVNALNAWVAQQDGFWWSTNRNGAASYPWPDPVLSKVIVTFRANGGIFEGGYNTSNRIYSLGETYDTLPATPSKSNSAFVGWWFRPEPDTPMTNLTVDLTVMPSVTSADASWSSTVCTTTPIPVSVETLASYYPEVADMDSAAINALAYSTAANGRDKVWELIFLDLDPTRSDTKASEVFVYMTSLPIQIHTVPETPLDDLSGYTIMGKEAITDAEWVEIGSLDDPIPVHYKFFMVQSDSQ